MVPAPTVLEISELNYPITRHRIINNPQLLTKILRGALANPLSTFPALVNVFNKPWLPAWRQSERNGYSVAYDLFKLVDEFGIKAVLNLRDMYGAPVINCVLNIPSEMYDTLVADVVNIPLISPHGSLCLLLILASDKYKTPLVIESFFNKHPVYLQVSDYYRYSYEQYVGKGTLPVIDSQVSANKILGMIITRINQTDSNNPQVHKQTVAWVVAVLRAASRYLTLEDILARPDKIALMSTFLGLQPDTVLAIAKAVDNYVGDYKGPHPTTLVKIAPFSLFMIAASALSLENGTTNAIHLFGTYTRFEANMLHYLTQAVYRGPLPQPIATLISSQEGFIASWIEDAILGYSQKTHLKM